VAIQVAVLAVLLGAVAYALTGIFPGAGARLQHAAVGWIALAVILELVAVGSYAALFQEVFSHGAHRIGWIRGAEIGVGELGAFVIVPTGAGGPALRIWALMRGGMPLRVVITRSVVHGAVLNLPYVLAATLLGLSVALRVGAGHAPLALSLVPVALVVGTVAVAVVAFRVARHQALAPLTRWRRIGQDVIQAIPEGLRELRRRAREPRLLLAGTGYWAGDCGVLIVAIHAAHGSAPIAVVVLAYMLGQLGNALPLPGGVGAVEPAMLGVLTASGVNGGVGAAAVVLYRFISLGLQAVAAGIAVTALFLAIQREPSQPA
jgi:uncharacterized membrane protein YbhN (UPF0104 family)